MGTPVSPKIGDTGVLYLKTAVQYSCVRFISIKRRMYTVYNCVFVGRGVSPTQREAYNVLIEVALTYGRIQFATVYTKFNA